MPAANWSQVPGAVWVGQSRVPVWGGGDSGAHPIAILGSSGVPRAGILLLEGTGMAGGSRRRKRRRENPLCHP